VIDVFTCTMVLLDHKLVYMIVHVLVVYMIVHVLVVYMIVHVVLCCVVLCCAGVPVCSLDEHEIFVRGFR